MDEGELETRMAEALIGEIAIKVLSIYDELNNIDQDNIPPVIKDQINTARDTADALAASLL
jgi:hypothetical protein